MNYRKKTDLLLSTKLKQNKELSSFALERYSCINKSF